MKKLNGQTIVLLKQPLNPAYISKFQKGEYISTSRVIRLANHIFGFGGWSAKTIESKQEHLDKVNGKYYATYSSHVEVRIHETDTIYSDVGVHTGVAKNIGEAISLAIKASRSIAFKRAMRHFGDQFGLSLYKNSDIQEMPTSTKEEEEYLYEIKLKEFKYYLNEVVNEYQKKLNRATKSNNKDKVSFYTKKIDDIKKWGENTQTLDTLNINNNTLIIKSVLSKMQQGGKK